MNTIANLTINETEDYSRQIKSFFSGTKFISETDKNEYITLYKDVFITLTEKIFHSIKNNISKTTLLFQEPGKFTIQRGIARYETVCQENIKGALDLPSNFSCTSSFGEYKNFNFSPYFKYSASIFFNETFHQLMMLSAFPQFGELYSGRLEKEENFFISDYLECTLPIYQQSSENIDWNAKLKDCEDLINKNSKARASESSPVSSTENLISSGGENLTSNQALKAGAFVATLVATGYCLYQTAKEIKKLWQNAHGISPVDQTASKTRAVAFGMGMIACLASMNYATKI